METSTFIWIGTGILGTIILFAITKSWIAIYNKFIYWKTRAERKFADIDVIIQQRIDMLPALAQVVKKYDIHEYKALKEIIETRSRWTKDASINEKVQAVQDVNNSFLKIQAVFEKYPQLKAEALHKSILGKGSISKMESKLSKFRLEYNRVAQKYNKRVQIFPRNIIALVHGFQKLPYLILENKINQESSEEYKAKKIFED
jgi:LemA protein